jgi:hypothetical protein
MKVRGIIVFVMIGLLAISCKKDIKPTVTFTVQDTVGNGLDMARIFTHPCFDGVSCDTTRVNTAFIRTGVTNSRGEVSFEYPYSAIIDVQANWTDCDTASGEWCIYTGRTVARFESKRTTGNEENNYNVKVVVREIK